MSKKNHKKENEKQNKEKKVNNKPTKNFNWGKFLQKAIIWLMLIVMVAFFVATIVWGLN